MEFQPPLCGELFALSNQGNDALICDGKMREFRKFEFFTCIMTMCVIGAVVMGQCEPAPAAGPVLHQDCLLSWDPNPEPDLAGYRVHLGRLPGALAQNSDVGNVTQVSCSRVGATLNGQWFVAVTAYNARGIESPSSIQLPFELTALPPPLPLTQVSEPAAVELTVREPGFQLSWVDTNLYQASHRIEMTTSLDSNWSTLTMVQPGITRLSYFHPVDVEWVCYRVRAESGALVSQWAQVGGSNDRQLCLAPTRVKSIDEPFVFPGLILEPQLVQLAGMQPGFQLTWENRNDSILQQNMISRIEVLSSVYPKWTTLTVLKNGESKFAFHQPIDAQWVCFRVRSEINVYVSLWGAGGSLNDPQFYQQSCYSPFS